MASSTTTGDAPMSDIHDHGFRYTWSCCQNIHNYGVRRTCWWCQTHMVRMSGRHVHVLDLHNQCQTCILMMSDIHAHDVRYTCSWCQTYTMIVSDLHPHDVRHTQLWCQIISYMTSGMHIHDVKHRMEVTQSMMGGDWMWPTRPRRWPSEDAASRSTRPVSIWLPSSSHELMSSMATGGSRQWQGQH